MSKDRTKKKHKGDSKGSYDHTTEFERAAALLTDFPNEQILTARKVVDDLAKRVVKSKKFLAVQDDGGWKQIENRIGIEKGRKMRIFAAATLLTQYKHPKAERTGTPDLKARITELENMILGLARQLGEHHGEHNLPVTRMIEERRESMHPPVMN